MGTLTPNQVNAELENKEDAIHFIVGLMEQFDIDYKEVRS